MNKPPMIVTLFLLCLASTGNAEESGAAQAVPELAILQRCYPEASFQGRYDTLAGDWKITVSSGGKTGELYRADGRFLSPGQLVDQKRYRVLIYHFPESVMDPANFTPEQKERISRFGSKEYRSAAPVSSTALFDILYDSATRKAVEGHLAAITFLGKQVRVHEKIVPHLKRAEAAIIALSQADAAVVTFIRSLESADGYYWRTIRDTAGRSFHSMGLAIDLLPRGWQDKIVYWNWEKGSGNAEWMLIPLAARWRPPESVVEAFEKEGFIWGGKWAIWDDMHFEYRPELIAGRALPQPAGFPESPLLH